MDSQTAISTVVAMRNHMDMNRESATEMAESVIDYMAELKAESERQEERIKELERKLFHRISQVKALKGDSNPTNQKECK